jgi:hypothetical protein
LKLNHEREREDIDHPKAQEYDAGNLAITGMFALQD